MEALQSPLVSHLLLPDRDVGTVISHIGVLRWQRRSKEHKWRLLRLEVSLIGSARPFTRHAEDIEEVGGKSAPSLLCTGKASRAFSLVLGRSQCEVLIGWCARDCVMLHTRDSPGDIT